MYIIDTTNMPQFRTVELSNFLKDIIVWCVSKSFQFLRGKDSVVKNLEQTMILTSTSKCVEVMF